MRRNFLFETEGFVNLTIYFIILLIFLLLYKLDVKGQIYPLYFTLVTYAGIYRSLSVSQSFYIIRIHVTKEYIR